MFNFTSAQFLYCFQFQGPGKISQSFLVMQISVAKSFVSFAPFQIVATIDKKWLEMKALIWRHGNKLPPAWCVLLCTQIINWFSERGLGLKGFSVNTEVTKYKEKRFPFSPCPFYYLLKKPIRYAIVSLFGATTSNLRQTKIRGKLAALDQLSRAKSFKVGSLSLRRVAQIPFRRILLVSCDFPVCVCVCVCVCIIPL